MAAYIIFTRESTRSPSELESYAPKARASMKGHAGTVRVAYGRQEMLEGAPVEGVVVVEIPTFEEAKAWYDSPARIPFQGCRLSSRHCAGRVTKGESGTVTIRRWV
jgi:uncharacterized protein (DUF1330 family)